ncbi:HAD-IC family P-type ATPase, partial [Agromyces seonyuensis]
ALPAPLAEAADAADGTLVAVARAGRALGLLELRDEPAEGAADAIASLRGLGLRPVLLTGDRRAPAERLAAQVGIAADDVRWGVDPEGKLAEVRSRQAAGERVAMVGDGVNDAAALAASDLGIAMGGGTDAALAASDLALVRSDPRAIPEAVSLARATLGTIRGNLFWAFAYNALAIPLAVLGILPAAAAAVAMAASSIFVVLNSLRLARR